MFFLDSRFPLYEYRHKLTEQLKHDVHALLTCFHIIKSVTHGKEHRLHSSSVRCGVELRVTLGDVTDSDKVGSGLKAVDALLKAFKSRYAAEVHPSVFANLSHDASRSKNAVASQFMFLGICFIFIVLCKLCPIHDIWFLKFDVINGIDRKKALAIYQNFIEGNNLPSEQERYLKNILDYVSVNGDIQTKNFTEYPLKALNWRVTFGEHFVRLKDFVKQIHQVISATA